MCRNASRIRVTDDGEAWLYTSDLSVWRSHSFHGIVEATVEGKTSEAALVLIYGINRPFSEETNQQDTDEPDVSSEPGEPGDGGEEQEDEGGSDPEHEPSMGTLFALDDSYF